MASLPSLPGGAWLSSRTLGGILGLYIGAKLSIGTSIPLMLLGGVTGYLAGGMV